MPSRPAAIGIGFILALALTECANQPYTDGEAIYRNKCANCHLDDGQGLGKLIPPLQDPEFFTLHRDQLPCYLRNGLNDTIIVAGQIYAENMPAMPELNDVDITNVLNYINHRWGDAGKPFSLEDVRKSLESCR